MAKISKSIGEAGEQQAISAMRRVGVEMIQGIATPTILRPVQGVPGAFYVTYKKQVSGDHTGIARGGLFVLAEVKTAFGRNLHWSDLESHQAIGLTEHDAHGGIALLVYVTDNGVHVLRWPVPGFGPGKGISPQKADALAINDEQGLLAGKLETYLE